MTTQPSLGFLVHDIARLIRADFAVRADQYGMTQTQLRTIAYLGRMEGCSQTELAAAIEVQPVTLGRQIDKLERSRLVERRRNAADRRTIRLYLTPRSRPPVRSLQKISRKVSARATASMNAGQRDLLLQMLEQVRANLAHPPARAAGSTKPSGSRPAARVTANGGVP